MNLQAIHRLIGILLATCAAPSANAATTAKPGNPFHNEAQALFVRCFNDPNVRSTKYGLDLSKIKVRFEDNELSDADRLNGIEYIGEMYLTFPFKRPEPGSQWQMGDYTFGIYYMSKHMFFTDLRLATTGDQVFFLKNNCTERNYFSAQ